MPGIGDTGRHTKGDFLKGTTKKEYKQKAVNAIERLRLLMCGYCVSMANGTDGAYTMGRLVELVSRKESGPSPAERG